MALEGSILEKMAIERFLGKGTVNPTRAGGGAELSENQKKINMVFHSVLR